MRVCVFTIVVRQHHPGEREIYIEARFGGLEVTVGDENEDIFCADMTGMYCFPYFSTAHNSNSLSNHLQLKGVTCKLALYTNYLIALYADLSTTVTVLEEQTLMAIRCSLCVRVCVYVCVCVRCMCTCVCACVCIVFLHVGMYSYMWACVYFLCKR